MSQLKNGTTQLKKYLYDARGERVRKSHDGFPNEVVHTMYDEAGHVLGDFDSNNAIIDEYIWLDDPGSGPGQALPVGVLSGATPTLAYIEPDHLGTPRKIIDPARNVAVWSWSLINDPFGETAPNQDPDGDGTLFVSNMRLPGQYFDVESGLNYNYFRDYDSGTGRYIESDPIGWAGGPSTYAYVNGDPYLRVDPKGLTGATTEDSWCNRNPVQCALIFGSGMLTVVPKLQIMTDQHPYHAPKCKKCIDVYPEYDLCHEMSRYYPYASAPQSLLDFPSGSKARTGTPALKGPCAIKGMHHTVFLNGNYVGSIFSCNCCIDTGGGPVLSEIWGNNADQ